MIAATLLFIGFDPMGVWLQQRFALPVPGALLGLVLLTVILYVRPQFATKSVRGGARILLIGMSMFFVPAGTGVITQMQQIRAQWLPILAGLLVSTIGSLLVCDWVMRLLDRATSRWFAQRVG